MMISRLGTARFPLSDVESRPRSKAYLEDECPDGPTYNCSCTARNYGCGEPFIPDFAGAVAAWNCVCLATLRRSVGATGTILRSVAKQMKPRRERVAPHPVPWPRA